MWSGQSCTEVKYFFKNIEKHIGRKREIFLKQEESHWEVYGVSVKSLWQNRNIHTAFKLIVFEKDT